MLQTKGIVFRTVKYGETSIIADIYTEDKGLHSFIAGNVRSARSNMPFSLFQPMHVLQLVSYFKDNHKSLNRLKEAQLAVPFERIPFDVRRGAVTLFMAEVLRKSIKEQMEDEAFFRFLLSTLVVLDDVEAPVPLIPVWFLAHLTDWLGICPTFDEIPDGLTVFLDLKEGVTTCAPNPLSLQLDAVSTKHLHNLIHTDIILLESIQIPATERRLLLDGLLKYYTYHIDNFGQVNAHEILNTVFHG